MMHQTPEDKAINRKVYGGLNHYARAYDIDDKTRMISTDTAKGYYLAEIGNTTAAARVGFVNFVKYR